MPHVISSAAHEIRPRSTQLWASASHEARLASTWSAPAPSWSLIAGNDTTPPPCGMGGIRVYRTREEVWTWTRPQRESSPTRTSGP